MRPILFLQNAIIPSTKLLPQEWDNPEARAMVLAICLQESGLTHRRQIGGPARSYAQFEASGGVRGVVTHYATKDHAQNVLKALDYSLALDYTGILTAMEHNDILTAAFARLLIYTLPHPLPTQFEPEEGWNQYLEAWRPGKPRPETWTECFKTAWEVV